MAGENFNLDAFMAPLPEKESGASSSFSVDAFMAPLEEKQPASNSLFEGANSALSMIAANPLTGGAMALTQGIAKDAVEGPDTPIGNTVQYGKDVFNSFMGGYGKLLQSAGWLIEQIPEPIAGALPFLPSDKGAQAMQEEGQWSSDFWLNQRSEEFEKAASAGLASPEFGATTLVAAASTSLPEMVLTMGASAVAGKLARLGTAVGTSRIAAAAEAGSVVAKKIMQYSKYAPAAAGALAGGGTEGLMAAGASGVAMEQRVEAMTHDQLMEGSDRYLAVYESAAGMDERERKAYAKTTVAEEMARSTAAWVGISTALLGAPTGAVLGYLGGRSAGAAGVGGLVRKLEGSVAGQAAVGFAGEGAQEFLQEGSQQFLQNLGLREYANKKQELSEGVLDAAVIGGLVGGVMGGAITPLAGGAARKDAKAQAGAEKDSKGNLAEGEFKFSRNPILEARIVEQLKGLEAAQVPAAEFMKVSRWAKDRTSIEFSKALEQLTENGVAPDNVNAEVGDDFDADGVLTEAAYKKDAKKLAFDVEMRVNPQGAERLTVLQALADNGANPYLMTDGTLVVPQSKQAEAGLRAIAESIERKTGVPIEIKSNEVAQGSKSEAAKSEARVAAKPAKPAEAEAVLTDEGMPEVEEIDLETFQNNASGESAASLEAIGRVKEEKALGRVRMMIDRDGTVRPIVGVDAVDTFAREGQVIVQRNVGKDEWTAISSDPKMTSDLVAGRINAAREKLAEAAVDEDEDPISRRADGTVTITPEVGEAGIEAMGELAAFNPANDIDEPSERQLSAGNYPKGHGIFKGTAARENIPVSIENVAGSIRKGKGWSRKMKHYYGYIRGTKDVGDGKLDVYIGKNAADNTLPVFVVRQNKTDGSFDEPKVILGYTSEGEAKNAYLSEYPANVGPKLFGGITKMTRKQFADYIESGETDVPPHPVSKKPMLDLRRGDVQFSLKGKWLVDESGQPMTVYHGTDAAFDSFDGESYFTSKKSVANEYAERRGGSRVVSANISIKAPFVVEADGDRWDDVNVGGMNYSQAELRGIFGALSSTYNIPEIVAAVSKSGKYDGVIVRGVKDSPMGGPTKSDVFVTFGPKQVKIIGPDAQFSLRLAAKDGKTVEAKPLANLPSRIKVDGKTVTFGPFQPARDAAAAYMRDAGMPYNPPTEYVDVVPERARMIAAYYHVMPHAPNDPQVKAAYDAMIAETLAQWEAIKKTGLTVEFNDGNDPYGNPRNAILDVVNNNHLYVFPTDEGFGSSDLDVSDNPLLADTGEKWGGHRVLVNDVFRVVHDYFGHIKEGVGFRADGEENAWRSHAAMYSPLARRAMTTETRGQNSWVNFGPYSEKNKTASGADTVYADQKIGLLPEWVSEQGATGDGKLPPQRPLEARTAAEEISDALVMAEARGNAEAVKLLRRIDLIRNKALPTIPAQTVMRAANQKPSGPMALPKGDDGAAIDSLVIRDVIGFLGSRPEGTTGLMFSLRKKAPVKVKAKKTIEREVPNTMSALLRNLTPKEQLKVTEKVAAKVVSMLERLPSADEMAAVAFAGKGKRGWYRQSAEAISAVFGPDAPRFAALLAAMSPQTSVQSNLRNALNTWANWVNDGRPTDREDIIDVMAKSVEGGGGRNSVLNAWINNSVRALTAEDPTAIMLSGPKVDSFMRNLVGDVNEVTNDTWMANYAAVNQTIFSGALLASGKDPGKGTGYLAMNALVRDAARRLTEMTGDTWTPAEVQETVWSWAKTIYEMADSATEIRSVEGLVLDRAITDELVQSTPDFGTLFTVPEYASVLEGAGYAQQVQQISARNSAAKAAIAEQAAAAQAEPFAPEAQVEYERAAARRLDALRRQSRGLSDEIDVPLSLAETVDRGRVLDHVMAVQAVNRIAASLKGAPPHAVVETVNQLPNHLFERITQLGLEDMVEGMFDPVTNSVYIVSRNVEQREDESFVDAIERIFAEETLGHYGLASTFGEKALNKLLDQVWEDARSTPAMREIVSNYSSIGSVSELRVKRYMANEYLSKFNPDVKPSTWERIVAWLRDALRAAGYARAWNDADLKVMMERVFDSVRLGYTPTSLERMRSALVSLTDDRALVTINDGTGPRTTTERDGERKIETPYFDVTMQDGYEGGEAAADVSVLSGDLGALADFVYEEGKTKIVAPLGVVTQAQAADAGLSYHEEGGAAVVTIPFGGRDRNANFNSWFADSKVVDANGQPMVVYHGSLAKFDTFDQGRAGSRTGDGAGHLGFFFSGDREVARFFTEDGATDSGIVPVYLAISNPKMISAEEFESDLADMTPEQAKAYRAKLVGAGHDGIIVSRDEGSAFIESGGDTYIAFRPGQIKSTSNRGTFDPNESNIMFSLRNRARGSDEVETILAKTVQEHVTDMTWGQRMQQWFREMTGYFGNSDTWLELKTGWIDSAAAIEKLERGQFDGKLLDASESAYKMVSLTKNLPQLMAAVSKVGVPEFRDGSFQRVAGRKGLYEIFAPLFKTTDGKNLLRLWEGYAIARRSSQLINQTNPDGTSKEKLLSSDEIARLLELENTYPVFAKVFDEWQTFNRELLDLAVERGALDKESANLWKQNDYVPFFRVDEEEDVVAGISRKRGLSGQRVTSKRLTGSDKRIQPVLENIMMNSASILEKVYKNEAMNRIVALADGVAMEQEPMRAEAVKLSNLDIAKGLAKAGLFVGDNTNSTPLQRKASKLIRTNDIDYAVRIVENMTPEQKAQWTTFFRRVRPEGNDVVSVMVAGKPVYYRVHDPLLLRAIMDMTPTNFGALIDFMGGAKRLLTRMVTLDPGFMAANWMRDTLSSWVVVNSGDKPFRGEGFRPFRDAPAAAVAVWTESGIAEDLALAGGMTGGFYDPTADFGAVMQEITDPGVTVLNSPKKLYHAYRKIGSVSEQVNRIALAKAVLRRGGSIAEAAYQSQDVLNFSQSGDAVAAQLLIRTVPFLNARIQGLYRLWKGARGLDGRDPRKAMLGFFLKGLFLAGLSMLLSLKNRGDERYEKLPDHQKDTYWHIFVGDNHFAIPKPFEVGVMFSTMPERAMRLVAGDDKAHTTVSSITRSLMDTFAFNPVPQLFKPVVEQWANRSFFSDRPIVGLELQGLEPVAQYNPWTSETARGFATALDQVVPDSLKRFTPETLRSPVRLESAMRAYLGTIGGYILQASDAALRQTGAFPAAPSMASARDIPVLGGALGRFVRGDPELETGNKYADDLYDVLAKADSAYRTLNAYVTRGNLEAAQALTEKRMDLLSVRPVLHQFREQAAEINTQQRLIMNSDMTPDEKRAAMDELTRTKNRMMKEAVPYLGMVDY